MLIVPRAKLSEGEPLRFLKTSLVHFPVGWAVANTEVLYEPDFFSVSVNSADEIEVAKIDKILSSGEPSSYNPFVAYMQLKRGPLLERNMEPADVADIIRSHLSPVCHVVYAEAPMKVWFVKMRLLDMSVGNTGFVERPSDELVFLKTTTLEICDKVCRECYLSGIPGVTAVGVNSAVLRHRSPENGEVIQKKCTVLETDGSNLCAALGLEEICGEMTTSNDVTDVLKTLGIEAAIRVLFDELQKTIGFDGNFINPRHLSLLVTLMSQKGYLVPVNRHGINRITGSR